MGSMRTWGPQTDKQTDEADFRGPKRGFKNNPRNKAIQGIEEAINDAQRRGWGGADGNFDNMEKLVTCLF